MLLQEWLLLFSCLCLHLLVLAGDQPNLVLLDRMDGQAKFVHSLGIDLPDNHHGAPSSYDAPSRCHSGATCKVHKIQMIRVCHLTIPSSGYSSGCFQLAPKPLCAFSSSFLEPFLAETSGGDQFSSSFLAETSFSLRFCSLALPSFLLQFSHW